MQIFSLFFRLIKGFFVGLFTPPWGILLPLSTLIFCGLFYTFDHFFQKYQANFLFSSLSQTPENKKNEIALQLINYDRSGTKLLIKGLSAPQETTARACFEALNDQIDQVKTGSVKDIEKRYLSISEGLATNIQNDNEVALNFAHLLVKKMQSNMDTLRLKDKYQISIYVQKINGAWQRTKVVPQSFEQNSVTKNFIASAGLPKYIRNDETVLPLLSEEYYSSNDFSNNAFKNTTTHVASYPQNGFYNLRKSEHDEPVTNILIPKENTLVSQGNPFYTEKLANRSIKELAKFQTQELMRLLNDTDIQISQKATQILKIRDGFQNIHVELASLLYHPDSKKRQALITKLQEQENSQLETVNWLAELLKDPDAEVRLYTAQSIDNHFVLLPNEITRLAKIIQFDDDKRVAACYDKLVHHLALQKKSDKKMQ